MICHWAGSTSLLAGCRLVLDTRTPNMTISRADRKFYLPRRVHSGRHFKVTGLGATTCDVTSAGKKRIFNTCAAFSCWTSGGNCILLRLLSCRAVQDPTSGCCCRFPTLNIRTGKEARSAVAEPSSLRLDCSCSPAQDPFRTWDSGTPASSGVSKRRERSHANGEIPCPRLRHSIYHCMSPPLRDKTPPSTVLGKTRQFINAE